MTPWNVARQAPLSMGFSRQEYRSGLPFLLWERPESLIEYSSPLHPRPPSSLLCPRCFSFLHCTYHCTWHHFSVGHLPLITECGFHRLGDAVCPVQSPQPLILLQSTFSIKVGRKTEDGNVKGTPHPSGS